MEQTQRDEYFRLRRRFEPTKPTLVIIAESPPTGGKYFYNPDGKVGEPLFKALMKQLGIEPPKTKFEGLSDFQKRGWVLVDATYDPVNALRGRRRDLVILRDYPKLCGVLKQLMDTRWSKTPLVLIKVNVCKLLELRLERDGFNVLNKGRKVYFPARHPHIFCRQFREIVPLTLRREGLDAEP
jgi:hypothetical protein